MSTGNIMLDPMIAKAPGATNVANVTGGANAQGILHLATIALTPGGSVTANGIPLSAAQNPVLTPDSFDIAGNMAGNEEFDVISIVPSSSGCTVVNLSSTTGAIYRIAAAGLGTAAGAQELRNAFQPVPATMTTQFLVRLVDPTGHVQYLPTCKTANAAGFTGTQPWVSIDTADVVLQTPSNTGTVGGVSGPCFQCKINPVQIVRWEITSSTNESTFQAQYATGLDNLPTDAIDPNKYDLMRTYVDATWNPVYQTSELVAEYAVDLKLAFSVDNTTLGDTLPTITTFAFDDKTDNALWGGSVAGNTTPPPNVGPQRIRSARVRLVTRAAQPDRSVNVPVTNFGAQTFLYRYCVNNVPSCTTADQTLRWARARTVTAEVALPNSAHAFY
jgi:hypothetical protein